MGKTNALFLLLVLLGAIVIGCISSDSTQTNTQELDGGSTTTPAVKSAEINGTFSGWLTTPVAYFDEIERFLNSTQVVLYTFRVEVTGKELNASIEIPILKLVPSFIPEDVNVSINGREIKGTTCVAYSEPLPVSISRTERDGQVETTAYLKVHPYKNVTFTARTSVDELNNATEKVLIRAGEMELVAKAVKPNDYVFTVLCNGTEVSSGGLEVGE